MNDMRKPMLSLLKEAIRHQETDGAFEARVYMTADLYAMFQEADVFPLRVYEAGRLHFLHWPVNPVPLQWAPQAGIVLVWPGRLLWTVGPDWTIHQQQYPAKLSELLQQDDSGLLLVLAAYPGIGANTKITCLPDSFFTSQVVFFTSPPSIPTISTDQNSPTMFPQQKFVVQLGRLRTADGSGNYGIGYNAEFDHLAIMRLNG